MIRHRLPRPLAALLIVAALCCGVRADEFTDRANAVYATIRPERRSDTVLLPVVAKMDAPPASCATIRNAMLLPAGSSGWAAAEQWATAAPQKAVLEALDKLTQEENPNDAYAFGQPYGSDALGRTPEGVALIRAGLYTDLGDPPMLAGARFLYLPALERVASLVNVEATRLAAAGKPSDAMHLLLDWLFFARQMADRASFQECRWGLRMMIVTFDRVRDVAYVDFRDGKRQLTQENFAEIIKRIRNDGGFLRFDRLVFPVLPRIAGEQVVAQVFDAGGKPNASFGQTMARLASTARPLRLFAEAARWEAIAKSHGDAADTAKQLGMVYDDLASRWPLDAFDPRMSLVSDYEKMNKSRFAVLAGIVPELTVLFNDRQVLRTQLVGTRCALGVLSFFYGSKSWPPLLESIRPRFLTVIDADPFNPDRARGKQPPLEYFVPIRDQKFTAGEAKKPHEINVVVGDQNFQVKVGDDQFVLYSVGPNGAKDWARDVSGEPAKGAIGDLLIWPPITSLLRQRQVETGVLK